MGVEDLVATPVTLLVGYVNGRCSGRVIHVGRCILGWELEARSQDHDLRL